MKKPTPEQFVRDMGLTFGEFMNAFPEAAGGRRYRVEGRTVAIELSHGSLVIQIGQTAERKLGSLAIPATRVEFRFTGVDASQRGEFLEQFDRRFQRAGG